MIYSSFSKLRILQLWRRGKRAPSIVAMVKRKVFKVRQRGKREPSIVAVVKRKVFKVRRRGKRAPSIAAVLKWEVFKVTRREFTTFSGDLQHMELFIGELFSAFFILLYRLFILLYYYRLL